MNSRTLPILLLLLLGLGALYVLTREDGKVEPSGPLAVEPFLAALDGVEPTTILVKNLEEEQKRYAFDLGSRPWRLTSPYVDEANPAPLASFLRQIDSMQRRLFATPDKIDDKMLEESGLKKPHGMYVLGTGDREVEVWIGDEGPALLDEAGGQALQTLFVRMDGSIYLVPKGFDHLLETNLTDLRNKILFLSEAKDIRKLRVQQLDEDGEKREVLIRRRKNGRYYLEKPYATPVNLQVLGQWLSGLLRVRVMEFLALQKPIGKNPAVVGPTPEKKPWMWIEVAGPSLDEKIELFRDGQGRVFAKKEGRSSLMLVDALTFRTLAQTPPQSLISTALWAWSPAQAWKLQVEVSSDSSETKKPQILVLANRQPQPGFKLVSPRVLLADPEQYNELFLALEKCRIRGVAEGAEAVEGRRLLAQPDVEVQLTPIPGKRRSTFSVKIAAGRAGRFFGTTTESDLVFLLDCPEFDKLGAAWWRYVEPLAFSYPPGRPILHMRILPAGGEPLSARADAKGWLVLGKPSEDMDEVYDVLRKLSAREILGETKVGVGAEILAKAQEIGALECYQGPPDQEEGPAATLRLYRDDQGRVLTVNGEDGLLYWLRGPDARDLEKILKR